MDDIMFQFLALPLSVVMRWIHQLIGNYGIVIIVFTFLIKIVLFPLTVRQQKSQARTSAYQPMIQDIQKKWANDKNRQQQEVMKFQEENGIKMTAGCLPMIVNMVVLFGMIGVIQAPLAYMVQMPADQIENAVSIVESYNDGSLKLQGYTQQSVLIGEINKEENTAIFIDGIDIELNEDEVKKLEQEAASAASASTASSPATAPTSIKDMENITVKPDGKVVRHVSVDKEWIDAVRNFDFKFLGLDLSVTPALKFNKYLILPILSILLQLASQVIIMKTGGQSTNQAGKSMWGMTIFFAIFSAYISFTVPTGFSLYYATSSVVATIQQLIVRKMYDPEKIKEEVMEEIEARKKAKKAKKKVKVKDEKGNVIEKEVSDAELAKIRLAKAREQDAKRYAESEEDKAKAQEATEKAKKMDNEKYGEAEESSVKEDSEVEKQD